MDHTSIESLFEELKKRHADKEVSWWQFNETCDSHVVATIILEKKKKAKRK